MHFRAVARKKKKLMTEAMSMKNLVMSEAIGPWLSSLPRLFMVTVNNRSERNARGKCLGWPVTSYG